MAFLDVLQLGDYLLWGVRLLVAVGAGLVGWYLTPPVFAAVHRLFIQEKANLFRRGVSRVAGTAISGLLGFLLALFLGLGDGMGGLFSGNGQIANKDKDKTPNEKKDTVPKVVTKDKGNNKQETLCIELVQSNDYQGNGKYFLIEKKGPPKTLEEVAGILVQSDKNIVGMEVIIYADSVSDRRVLPNLQKLAQDHKLEWKVPTKYHNMKKKEASSSG